MVELDGPFMQPLATDLTFGEPAEEAGTTTVVMSGRLLIAGRQLAYKVGEAVVSHGRVRLIRGTQQTPPWVAALLLLWNLLWAWIEHRASKREG